MRAITIPSIERIGPYPLDNLLVQQGHMFGPATTTASSQHARYDARLPLHHCLATYRPPTVLGTLCHQPNDVQIRARTRAVTLELATSCE
eukprot:COSAG02_NODE_562_length_20293_cov_37.104288_2_plen_90_part_00